MRPDIIVIGLGAMGSAALYQLARRGCRVLGIDRFAPPHDRGSSHGETRITRRSVGEGAAYVPFAVRSHEIWRELEAETGEQLLLECGFLAIDGAGGATPFHGREGFFDRTVAAAEEFGIDHERLSVQEARSRFPQFRLQGHERLYFEPGGGLVYPERCIAAQLGAARKRGAEIRLNETVAAIEPLAGALRLRTDRGSYETDRVVLAAGGWSIGLAGDSLRPMKLFRQVLHWFAPAQPDLYRSERCPTYIWNHGTAPSDSFYGFPIAPGTGEGVKVAAEHYEDPLPAPESMRREVDALESAAMFSDHVEGRLALVTDRAIRSAACFYTFAPGGDFVIDRSPGDDRIFVVSACSGHGFKHSAGIGEHVAELAIGEAAAAETFSFARLTGAVGNAAKKSSDSAISAD